MGNNQPNFPTGYDPVQGGWEIKEKNEQFNVWRNPETGEEVDEYRRLLSDRREYDFERDTFNFRYNSNSLVSSVYLKEEAQYDMCSTFYKANLFLEHINHRLSDIDHIPYPDVLHMYHQAFRGFAELYDRVGYFEVEENLICMNQQGKVKVWLNQDLSKGVPQPLFAETHASESNMLRKIINVIHANTDTLTLPENILDTMRRNSVSTFREADNVLQQIALRHRTTVPSRLDCVLEMDSHLLNEVRRTTTVTTGPVVQQPQKTITTLTETFNPAAVQNYSVVQPPAVQIPALATAPVVQYPISRQSLPIQARTTRINSTPGIVLDTVKPFSSGFIPAAYSNHGSRMSCGPVIGKPATAIAYNTVSPPMISKPLTAVGGVPAAQNRPLMRTVPNPKSASAINFYSSMRGIPSRPVTRTNFLPSLPVISEKASVPMKRVSGTTQKQTKVTGARAPSYTTVTAPKTFTPVNAATKGIDLKLVNSAKSTTVINDVKITESQYLGKNNVVTPPPVVPKEAPVPKEAYQQPKFTETNFMSSPINIAKNIDTVEKPVEFSSSDFYTRFGLSQQKDSIDTNFRSSQIVSTPAPATTNYQSNFGTYESNQETTSYNYGSYEQVSPSPVVQPITHTNVSTSDHFTVPISIDFNTESVKTSIPYQESIEYKTYSYESYKSPLDLAPSQALDSNYDYLNLNTTSHETPYTKSHTTTQAQTIATDFNTYKATTTVSNTETDNTNLASYSPPKVQFTYSSSNLLIPSTSQLPSSGYSRTIYEGSTSVANYGDKGYQTKVETYQAEITTGTNGAYNGGVIGNIQSTISSYVPSSTLSTSNYGLTNTNVQYTRTPIHGLGQGTGISPPSSRVAQTFLSRSPPKLSPSKNNSSKDYEQIKYTSYENNASSYSQSQAAYNYTSYESYSSSSAAITPSISYQTPSTSSYQPPSIASYQPPSIPSYQPTNSYQTTNNVSSSRRVSTETSNYSVAMDTDLLKDLQKLKKQGTLSPKKQGSPSPRKEEFNTGMSFGNNSGYIRDSLKAQIV